MGNTIREYFVYVPAIYDGADPVPLMFNFHGYTGQASNHLNTTRMKLVADTAGFILVAPQGSLFSGNTHWNVGAWTVGSSADDLGFTEAMIDTLAAQYNIDLERVYSCGYSNGGYFSFELACKLSNRIAAIGAVGGKMSSQTFNACNPSHPIPVVTIHGTTDNIVTYQTTVPSGSKTIPQVNEYWMNINNTDSIAVIDTIPNTNTSDGSTVEYFSYKNGENCTSVDHYKVIGGGHDWPGAWGNKDIDSSPIIWNFVSQYDINGLIDCNTTSVEQDIYKRNEILIYPNPAKESVTIDIELVKELECRVYSLNGSFLLSRKINSENKTIDLSGLPSNIYILRLGHQAIRLIKE